MGDTQLSAATLNAARRRFERAGFQVSAPGEARGSGAASADTLSTL